ncbi:hypothetical protein ES703_92698 [subsurface metagenome]
MSGEGVKGFKTVEAPPRKTIGQPPFEQIPAPERWRYQWFGDAFTRMDGLLEAILKASNVTIEQNNTIIILLGKLAGIEIEIPGVEIPGVEYFRDYLTEDQLDNKDVVNAETPVELEVLELMGRRARFGFVYSETGTINLRINDRAPIPVKAADFLNLGNLRLEIEKMRIETESVADITFRLLLV